MAYPRGHRRGRKTYPRVSWTGEPNAQAQCDRCWDWVLHSSLREQLEYRGGTAPVGTGIMVCGKCYDVPNPSAPFASGSWVGPPGGAFNDVVLRQDPEPVLNARPDTTTYDLTIPTYTVPAIPPAQNQPPGTQIYIAGVDPDPILCYADGFTWLGYYTGALVFRSA